VTSHPARVEPGAGNVALQDEHDRLIAKACRANHLQTDEPQGHSSVHSGRLPVPRECRRRCWIVGTKDWRPHSIMVIATRKLLRRRPSET
jgi:hypothetical protein